MGHRNNSEVSRGFEPRSLDSGSRVLTVTPRGHIISASISFSNVSCSIGGPWTHLRQPGQAPWGCGGGRGCAGEGPPKPEFAGSPPCARGPLCLPLLRSRPFLLGCGGLPPVQASAPGLLVRIIQGSPQMLIFCLRMPIFPKLWLVALWQPAGEVWRSFAHLVAHCLLQVAAWGSDLRAGT